MHEIARIDDLERKLAQVEADGGDIAAILGTGDRALRTSVALQALRAAEPLSPLLKDTLDQDAVKGPVTKLGAGAFNEVRQAQLEFKDANGNTVSGRFALTRLDTRIFQAGGAALRGQSSQQTRAFARHAAAFEISEALGLNLVGEPRLISVDGELSMAVPIAPGDTPGNLKRSLRDLPEKDHKADIPRRVKEALHANIHMQNAMQKVQLLFAAIGHADGHSSNLHIQYLDEDGREVTHDQIIDLVRQGKDDVVSSLQVKVQVFDLDSAFPNIRTLKPQYVADRGTRHRAVFMDGKEQDHVLMPRRTHNMGPAPFHTNNDLKRLIGLKAELESGVLGIALQWYLLRDGTGATDELGALEARVSENIDLIQQQFEEGRLLDEDTGRVLRRGAQRSGSSVGLEASGPPNQQRRLNDTAPTMISPIAGRVNAKKNREEKLYGTVPQSLIHKYIRLA